MRKDRICPSSAPSVVMGDSEDTDGEAPVVSPLEGAETPARAQVLRWRWGLRLGALTAVVTLLAVVAVALAPVIPWTVAPPLPLDNIALALPPELRFCATDGYWSPDGRRIAVPRAPACGASGAGARNLPDIYIFDAASGAQSTEYTIMPAIQDALARASLSGAQVNYSGVTWSPDQRTMAAEFDVLQFLPHAYTGTHFRARAGVALIALAGPHPGAVTALISARGLSPAAERIGYTPGPLAVDEWDTRQLTARPLDLPATLEYQWLPGDLLIGANPPPVSAWPAENPAGRQRFSMWRMGYLVEVSAVDCGQSSVPGTPYTVLYLFTTAWAPDGRYLLTITQVARAPRASLPSVATPFLPFCLSGSAAAFPQAPVHDRAMRAALGLLGSAVSNVELLWSPDGVRLAAIPSETSQASNAITIYDMATGAILARVFAGPSQIPGAQGSDANARFINGSWSPDGRRLLAVVEGQQFNIRVYGPRALS